MRASFIYSDVDMYVASQPQSPEGSGQVRVRLKNRMTVRLMAGAEDAATLEKSCIHYFLCDGTLLP